MTNHNLDELVLACRLVARLGLDFGATGHISCRASSDPNDFWLPRFGASLSTLKHQDLVRTSRAQAGKLNPPAVEIHRAIYAARPEIGGVAHAHSPAGKAWSTLGLPLTPITQDSCAFFEDHILYDRFTGVIEAPGESERLAKQLGQRKAAILANHGLLTVGHTVGAAAWWLIALDSACEVQLRTSHLTTRPISDSVARQTYELLGAEKSARRHFEALAAPLRSTAELRDE